jgi:hypothetical protein
MEAAAIEARSSIRQRSLIPCLPRFGQAYAAGKESTLAGVGQRVRSTATKSKEVTK